MYNFRRNIDEKKANITFNIPRYEWARAKRKWGRVYTHRQRRMDGEDNDKKKN